MIQGNFGNTKHTRTISSSVQVVTFTINILKHETKLLVFKYLKTLGRRMSEAAEHSMNSKVPVMLFSFFLLLEF